MVERTASYAMKAEAGETGTHLVQMIHLVRLDLVRAVERQRPRPAWHLLGFVVVAVGLECSRSAVVQSLSSGQAGTGLASSVWHSASSCLAMGSYHALA